MASDLGPKAQLNAPTESRSGLRHEIEGLCHHDHEHESHKFRHHDNTNDENISIPSNSKHAEQAIAPFLAKHIPTQYNPVGHLIPQSTSADLNHDHHQDPSSTKFCYRHRPDLKCRRQANEPSMEQLQNELGTVSQSDQQAISHVWSLFSAAPSKHRNLMLQGILSQCCFPQLSYISASVRDL
ncbi:WD40 repeat-like protein, partial [Aureobasidium melanogenum]